MGLGNENTVFSFTTLNAFCVVPHYQHAKGQSLFLREYPFSSGLILRIESSVLHQRTQVTSCFEGLLVLYDTLLNILLLSDSNRKS